MEPPSFFAHSHGARRRLGRPLPGPATRLLPEIRPDAGLRGALQEKGRGEARINPARRGARTFPREIDAGKGTQRGQRVRPTRSVVDTMEFLRSREQFHGGAGRIPPCIEFFRAFERRAPPGPDHVLEDVFDGCHERGSQTLEPGGKNAVKQVDSSAVREYGVHTTGNFRKCWTGNAPGRHMLAALKSCRDLGPALRPFTLLGRAAPGEKRWYGGLIEREQSPSPLLHHEAKKPRHGGALKPRRQRWI